MGAIAAAVLIRKEEEIVATFRVSKALTSTSAGRPSNLGIEEGVAFRRLRARAVLREAAAGTFYLDEPSWEAFRTTRRRLAMILLTLVFVLGIGAYLISR